MKLIFAAAATAALIASMPAQAQLAAIREANSVSSLTESSVRNPPSSARTSLRTSNVEPAATPMDPGTAAVGPSDIVSEGGINSVPCAAFLTAQA